MLFTTERATGAIRHPAELGLVPRRGQTSVDLRLDLAVSDRIPGAVTGAIVRLLSDRGVVWKRRAFTATNHPPLPAGASRALTLPAVLWPTRAQWLRLEVELLGEALAFVHASIEAPSVGAGSPHAPRARALRSALFAAGLDEWPVPAERHPVFLRELQELARVRRISGAARAQFLHTTVAGDEDRAELVEALRDLPVLMIDALLDDLTRGDPVAMSRTRSTKLVSLPLVVQR
jgi:hypothetical protein